MAVERGDQGAAAAPASGAILSPCGTYRYRLWRRWDLAQKDAVFIMLNPSTADDISNDRTIGRCIGYAKRNGCGGLEVANLFGYRSTSIPVMTAASDPIGPDNDLHLQDVIAEAMHRGNLVIAAWDSNGLLQDRNKVVLAMLRRARCTVMRIGAPLQNGAPRHPSRGSYLPLQLLL